MGKVHLDMRVTYDIKGLTGPEFSVIRRALLGKGFNRDIANGLIAVLEGLREAAANSMANTCKITTEDKL